MSKYQVELSKRAEKFIVKVEKTSSARILDALDNLSEDPYGYNGIIKMTGYNNRFRLKIGKYRVVYSVENDILLIVVVDIDSRGGIYKRM